MASSQSTTLDLIIRYVPLFLLGSGAIGVCVANIQCRSPVHRHGERLYRNTQVELHQIAAILNKKDYNIHDSELQKLKMAIQHKEFVGAFFWNGHRDLIEFPIRTHVTDSNQIIVHCANHVLFAEYCRYKVNCKYYELKSDWYFVSTD